MNNHPTNSDLHNTIQKFRNYIGWQGSVVQYIAAQSDARCHYGMTSIRNCAKCQKDIIALRYIQSMEEKLCQ